MHAGSSISAAVRGNSTELLVKRWPQAAVTGIDTSADMLRQARERLPAQKFVEANVAHWAPPENTDVLFANAIFQWVPGHLKQLQRLIGACRGAVCWRCRCPTISTNRSTS